MPLKARVENENYVIFSVPLSITPHKEEIKNNGQEALFQGAAMEYVLAAPADTNITIPILSEDQRRIFISLWDDQRRAHLRANGLFTDIREETSPIILNGIVFEYQESHS